MKKILTRSFFIKVSFLLAVATICSFTGCATSTERKEPTKAAKAEVEPLKLREGDTLEITFPGAPSLNTEQMIKRDGRIALLVGEVTAAGKTIAELQKELLDLYSPQLVTKLVVVSVKSSLFPIYVTGAVSRNGRLIVDRPMTVLEAVMEAGVDLGRANLKGVRLTRVDNEKTKVFRFNLDRWLKGNPGGEEPFYVVPSDIIFVPEKFQWF